MTGPKRRLVTRKARVATAEVLCKGFPLKRVVGAPNILGRIGKKLGSSGFCSKAILQRASTCRSSGGELERQSRSLCYYAGTFISQEEDYISGM